MTIFFTSDTHFGHENIIKYTNRPFADADEMDRVLISNINDCVSPRDVLYVLGDFAMGRGKNKLQHAADMLSRINCKNVYLVIGNHDVQDFERLKACGFTDVYQYKEISHNGMRFCLMHYPLLEWNGFYRDAYDLHGHVHNDANYNEDMRKRNIKRYDVGVDANGYAPVSIDEIVDFFSIEDTVDDGEFEWENQFE